MPEEGFLRRWARLKSTGGEAAPADAPRAPAPPAPVTAPGPAASTAPDTAAPAHARPDKPLPTLEDAARLTPDADFSAFVAQGVDKSVQRLALKKLFADPHFNAIDGLDIYMNDYNKAAPMTPAMLASLKHAPGVLSRLFGDEQDGAEVATGQGQEQEAQQEAHEEVQEVAHEEAHEAARQAPPSTRQGNA